MQSFRDNLVGLFSHAGSCDLFVRHNVEAADLWRDQLLPVNPQSDEVNSGYCLTLSTWVYTVLVTAAAMLTKEGSGKRRTKWVSVVGECGGLYQSGGAGASWVVCCCCCCYTCLLPPNPWHPTSTRTTLVFSYFLARSFFPLNYSSI